MAIICIDTPIIIQGALPADDKLIDSGKVNKSKQLLNHLDSEKHKVILPTIVIGESLVKIPEEKHDEIIVQLRELGPPVTYTLKAAKIFASIFALRSRKGIFRSILQDNNSTRASLKADLMIAATAKAHSATKLYTIDSDFVKLKKLLEGIEVIHIDEFEPPPKQLSFLED